MEPEETPRPLDGYTTEQLLATTRQRIGAERDTLAPHSPQGRHLSLAMADIEDAQRHLMAYVRAGL